MNSGINKIQQLLKDYRDNIYHIQTEFEDDCKDDDLMYQSIRTEQRILALLNIYSQMVTENRKFDEDYLKRYGV